MSYPTWMNDNQTTLGPKKLNEILLPGTHDTGTYAYNGMSQPSDWAAISAAIAGLLGLGVTALSWSVALAYTITQDRNIAQQLGDGIRYLDIRTNADNGTLYTVHGFMPHTPKVILGTGSGNARGVVQDVADFVAAHPRELVILDFQEFQEMTAGDYTTLFNTIVSVLGAYLVGPTINGHATLDSTMSTIWGNSPTAGKVIVMFDKSDATLITQSNAWNSLFWDRGQYIASPWANTDDSDRLRNFLYLENPHQLAQAGMLPVLQGQLTTISNINFTSLYNAAVSNNPQVNTWLSTGRLGTRWTVAILDYYNHGGSDFVANVISINTNGWPAWTGSTTAFWGGDVQVSSLGTLNKQMPISPSTDRAPAAITFSGKLHVFYRDADSNRMFLALYDGTRWTGGTEVTAIGEDVDGAPGLATFQKNGKNYLLLVYKADGSTTLRAIFYDGSSWSKVSTPGIKSTEAPSLAPYVSSDNVNKIMIGYVDDNSTSLKFAQYVISSGEWKDQGKISNHSSLDPKSDHAPTVVNYNGVLYFFYSGETFDDLYQTTYNPSTAKWAGNATISSLSGGISPAADSPPAAAVYQNKIWLVYESATLDDVYWCTWDGDTWVGNTELEDATNSEIDPSTDQSPTLAMFGSALYLFYKGWNSNNLYVSANAQFHNWVR